MLTAIVIAAAQAAEVGAIVRPDVSVDLAADRDHEDTVEAYTRVRAFARDDLENDAQWFLEVWGQHDLLVGQGALTGSNDKDDVEGAWEVRVGESGWQGRLGSSVDLRIGNLVERWGKLDLLPQVDVINPRDMRVGPLVPQEFQRLPIPMAVLGVGKAPVRGELVLIPFSSADRMNFNGTDWSIARQEMLEDQLAEMAGWNGTDLAEAQFQQLFGTLSDSLDDLDPSFRRGLVGAANQQNLPQALGIHGEAAARLEIDVPNLDAALMVGALRSRRRAPSLNRTMADLIRDEDLPEADQIGNIQAGQLVEATWPRTYVAGAEASTVVGPFGIRGEGLFTSHQVVAEPWLQSSTTPLIGTGLGVDYANGSVFYAAVEVSYRTMLDPPDRVLLETPDALQIGGGVRLNVAADRVEFQLGGAYHVQFGEYLARPTVAWRVSDHVELEGGAVILGGPVSPPDTLRQAMNYRGGFLGYFGQNDAATFAVSWIL